jgi:hypothetical protein
MARQNTWASADDHVAIGASMENANEQAPAHSFAFVMFAATFGG